jgi:hypothetical protein
VKQGKTFLQVTQLIPSRAEAAALQLFILIDDTLDSRVGNNLNEHGTGERGDSRSRQRVGFCWKVKSFA